MRSSTPSILTPPSTDTLCTLLHRWLKTFILFAWGRCSCKGLARSNVATEHGPWTMDLQTMDHGPALGKQKLTHSSVVLTTDEASSKTCDCKCGGGPNCDCRTHTPNPRSDSQTKHTTSATRSWCFRIHSSTSRLLLASTATPSAGPAVGRTCTTA